MKKALVALLVVIVGIGGYLAGARRSAPDATSGTAVASRQIAYYACPMHPQYKSDHAGDCPSCGMRLEPVYAEGVARSGGAPPVGSAMPGTVQVSADKQQLMGLSVGVVERAPGRRVLRVPGRVAAAETRIYRVNAAVEGWVQDVSTNSTGSLVKKDEILAAFYAPEFLSAEQAYIYALSSFDRFQATGNETADQIKLTKAAIQQAADALRNMGMSETQVASLAKERELVQKIDIRSPADGIILQRDVSPGQRFEKGTEFYRIADLRQVWILADVFGADRHYLQPGLSARVTLPEESLMLTAKVANVPPQFDPVSRTLKVRLEAPNPNDLLRPEMFVDVEIDVNLPESLTVPADAVIDSGLRKTVFVEHGTGVFEPRVVRTGWKAEDRIEIVEGLQAGERIVVSGAFLMDSDSRMKAGTKRAAAEAGQTPTGGPPIPSQSAVQKAVDSGPETDPVCNMKVAAADARKSGLTAVHAGKTYYFCSEDCKRKFEGNPRQYVATPARRP